MVNNDRISGVIPLNLNEASIEDKSSVFSSTVKRIISISGSLVVSGLFGYVFGYWAMRLVVKVFKLDPNNFPVQATSFVVTAMCGAAIIESAKLIYDLALYSLGNREEILKMDIHTATFANGLRKRIWKVIDTVDGTVKKTDEVFSKYFGIRTVEEITKGKIKNEKLTDLEIFRKVVLMQISMTCCCSLPIQFGADLAASYGYKVFLGPVTNNPYSFQILSFFLGIPNNFINIKNTIDNLVDKRVELINSQKIEQDLNDEILRRKTAKLETSDVEKKFKNCVERIEMLKKQIDMLDQ